MKQKNSAKRMAAAMMAVILAISSAVQPGWYAAAAGPEAEHIGMETAEEKSVREPDSQPEEDRVQKMAEIVEEQDLIPPQSDVVPAAQVQGFAETEVVSPVTEAGPDVSAETLGTGAEPDVKPENPGVEQLPDVPAKTESGTEAIPEISIETEPETVPAVPAETEVSPDISVEIPATEAAPDVPEKTPVTEAAPDVSAETPGTEAVPDMPAETPGTETSPDVSVETPGTETSPDVSVETPGTETSPDVSAEDPGVEQLPDAPAKTESGTEATPDSSIETEPETAPVVPAETEEGGTPETETEEITILETELETQQDIPTEETESETEEVEEPETEAMYAILYENGELVFQKGETPDPEKGNVRESMTGFEDLRVADRYSWPWYSACRSSIRAVSFKDRFCPVSAEEMFYDCENLTSFDSRNFDTSALTSTAGMFYNCASLTTLDTGDWKLSAVTEMDNMFYGCAGLTELDTGGWKLSAVKKMDYMFYGCTGLTELNMSSWDMSGVTSMQSMFENCQLYRLVLGPMCRLESGAPAAQEEYYTQGTEISSKVRVFFDTQEGGTIDPLEITPGDVYGKTVRGIIPVREGYTFIAWHKGSLDGAVVGETDRAGQEDISLFAEWKRNPVITFDTNGGGPETSQKQVEYGGKIGTLPKYPSNGGSTAFFAGWFTEASGGDMVQPDWIVYEDVTYYAHWGWRPVFNTDGGIFTEFPEYPLQESPEYLIQALPGVRRDGFRLSGWFLADKVTEVKAGQVLDLSQGSEITAHWEPMDTVKLTLDPSPWDKEFSIYGKETYEVYRDQPVRVLPEPKNKPSDGREFLGWFDEGGTQWTVETVITEDTELHAAWSKPTVKVTFDADGGSGLSNSSLLVPAGSTIDVLPGARRNNYILEGWYTEKNGGGEKLTTETVILEETTYYAHWVSFFLNTSDQTAFYVYGAEWGNASNENVDVTGDTLIVHPTDAKEQTAQLHVRFEMNVSVGDLTLPAGTVKIQIPKYVWKDWDGNDIGTNNLSVNLPQYPDVRSGMFFSYMDEGDHYLLINNQDLSGGAGVDVVISYNVKPGDVPGGATDAQGRYVDGYEYYKGKTEVTFYVDADNNGDTETVKSKELFLEMHTRISSSPAKKLQGIYYDWQSRWGERPEDADDYFYASWELRTYFSSNTNQAGTYEWTEDGTVHDGTLVAIKGTEGTVSNVEYVSEAILRYPVELLRDAPAEGVLLHNEALLTINWKSGYKTVQKVQADKRIYRSQYPPGEFGKQRPYYSSSESERNRLIQGGQEKLVEDETDVSMQWRIVYKGGAREVPGWDEQTGTYTVPERTIRIRDGMSKDVLYSSGKPSARYVWDPETGNVELSDDDYSFTQLKVSVVEYDAECRDGLWTAEKSHSEPGDIKGVDIYIRYRGSDQLSYWTSIPGSSLKGEITVAFPEGTVGFEARHKSSFYLTKISLEVSANVHPTQTIKTLVSGDMEAGATSLIKNKAYCDVWETEKGEESAYFSATNYKGGRNSAIKEIWELNMSQTIQCACKKASKKEKVVLDVDRGTQDSPIYIAGWNYNSSGNVKQLHRGILYDLLPAGATVDVSSLFGFTVTGYTKMRPENIGDKAEQYDNYKKKTGKLSASNYDVRFSDDWKGSGRTMMTITFTLPDSPEICGVEFYYLLHNTYENILLHGTTVENDLAFVNTSSGRVRPVDVTGKQSVIEDAHLYDELQEKYEGFIAYAEASVNYIPVDAYSWGFEKSVKTYSDYRSKGEAFPGTEYTYKLSYSQSDYAESSGIVFYDLLEGGYFIQDDSGQQKMESQWHGTFTGVDVHEITQKLTGGSDTVRCSPVVWYATKDRDSFTGADFDLTRTEIWNTSPPEDLSSVTAVAVDCRKNTDGTEFALVNRQVMDVYIHMRAPENVPTDAVYTYNEGRVLAKQRNDNEPTELTSDAQVEIIAGEPELHKESDPATGTEENPAPLEQEDALNYTLSVTNSGTVRTMTDVVVEDDIPDGLDIMSSEITVWFSDAEDRLKVSESPRISMTESGRHLKFVISTLLAGETAYISIPCKVSLQEGLLVNTAHVTSVDGVKKDVSSETTYHEVVPRGTLSIRKTVKGSLGDKSWPFSFRLKFTTEERELPGVWNCKKGDVEFTVKPDEDGYLTFQLSDGETIEFLDVPRGTGYEVEETDGASMGYEIEAENDSGTIGANDVQVSFVNTKNGFVPTGVWSGLYKSLTLALAAAAAIIRMFLRKRIQG